MIVAALRKPLLVLRVAVPYVIILALFAGFVVWNGSVVLGEQLPRIMNSRELT